jgi:hypothetical protein
MGMFDTIIIPERLKLECPFCKNKIKVVQTKNFSNTLASYKEGDFILLDEHQSIEGIYKDTVCCSSCMKFIQKDIYFSVRLSTLIKVTLDVEEARKSIAEDFTHREIENLYIEKSKKLIENKGEINALINNIKRFSNFLDFLKGCENSYQSIIVGIDIIFIKSYLKDNIPDTLREIVKDYDK